jgi:hypothetical protein
MVKRENIWLLTIYEKNIKLLLQQSASIDIILQTLFARSLGFKKKEILGKNCRYKINQPLECNCNFDSTPVIQKKVSGSKY